MEKQFGTYLKHLRTNRGLTVRQLSGKTNISASHISNVENGKRNSPKIEFLISIIEALELTQEEKTKLLILATDIKTCYNLVPKDLIIYMLNNKRCLEVIKCGQKLYYDDLQWNEIIEFMKIKS